MAKKVKWERPMWPTKNKWDIPELLPGMLADQIPTKVWNGNNNVPIKEAKKAMYLWGTNKLPADFSGAVLGFYVDDSAFQLVFRDPPKALAKIKTQKFGCVMTPDFSIWRNWPLALQIYQRLCSQWCGRYWQENGIKIIPSLNWSDDRSFEFAFLGIPKNAPVLSCQCRTLKTEEDKFHHLQGINHAIKLLSPKNLIVYGGTRHAAWIKKNYNCKKTDIHLLTCWTDVRRPVIEGRSKKKRFDK